MNRVEFLSELEKRLKFIPKEDRDDAIAYYDEYIGDSGLSDDADVTMLLGSPKDVANNIISECTVKHATEVTEPAEKKSVKNNATTVWLAILGVASLPISLPIVIVAVVLVLTFVIVAFSIVLAFGLSGIAIVLSGIAGIVAAFFAVNVGSVLSVIGMGIAAIGIGVLITIGAIEFGKVVVKAIAAVSLKISSNRRNG